MTHVPGHTQEHAPALELYYRDFCPYCNKVRAYMDEHGIDLPMHCINREEGAEEHLVEIGGKAQVPCLIIDGQPLYESDDIIAYLKEHVSTPLR